MAATYGRSKIVFHLVLALICFRRGVDSSGNDIGPLPDVASPFECQIRCQKTPNCVGFVWSEYNSCYPKTAIIARPSYSTTKNNLVLGSRDGCYYDP